MDSKGAQARIAITPDVLGILVDHLEGAGGATSVESALRAAGREWGYRDERRGAALRVSPLERLAHGLKALETLGLAAATIDSADLGPQQSEWNVAARLKPLVPAGAGESTGLGERARYQLASGYLAGWLASLAGFEVDYDLLRCEPGSEDRMCVLRPAPRGTVSGVIPRRRQRSQKGDLSGLGIELEDLVEITLDTIVFLDSEGTVRYWNRGATLMFGYECEEVLGRNISFLIPRDLIAAGEQESLRAACAAEGVLLNHTTRRLRKDGSTIWVSLTRTVSRDPQGREVGIVATMRDITAQRDREQELQRSRSLALVGELAAKVAHEVKNPLAGIYAALQVLEGQLEPTDPRREIFDSIGDEVIRLNEITQGLLNFARPPEPKMRKADLTTFLVDLVGDLERLSMASAGQIEYDDLESGLKVPFDPDLTGHVFKNLILNGLQANAGSGTVRLSSRWNEGTIAIDVADSGPGIKKQNRASIFEPFFTTKNRGSGLGLSIAKKNVEAQGGSIRLRSHRGKGAIFRVEFPAG